MGSGLNDIASELHAVILALTTYEDKLGESSRGLMRLAIGLEEAVGASKHHQQVRQQVTGALISVRGAAEAVAQAKAEARRYTSETTVSGGGAGSGAATAAIGAATALPAAAAAGTGAAAAALAGETGTPAPGTADGETVADSPHLPLLEKMHQKWEKLQNSVGLKSEDQINIARTQRQLRTLLKETPDGAPNNNFVHKQLRGFMIKNLHTDDSLQQLETYRTNKFLETELDKLQAGVSQLSEEDLASRRAKVVGWLARFNDLTGPALDPLPQGSLEKLMDLSAEIKTEFPHRPGASLADLLLQADPGMAAIYVAKLLGKVITLAMDTAISPAAGIPVKVLSNTLSASATKVYKHSHSCLTREKDRPSAGKILATQFGLELAKSLGSDVLFDTIAKPFMLDFMEEKGIPIVRALFERAVSTGATRPSTRC